MKRLLILFCLLTANNVLGMQASALLSAIKGMYNAAYFILPNYPFVYDAWERVNQTRQLSQMKFPTIANMEEVNLPQATKQIIKESCEEMQLSKEIRVHTQPMHCAGRAAENMLVLDPELIKLHTLEEQKATIRHEFAHIKNKDYVRTYQLWAALPFISYGVLTLAEVGLQRTMAHSVGHVKYVNILQKIPSLINNISTYYLLNCFLSSLFSKKNEYKADYDAVNCSAMGVALVESFIRASKSDYKPIAEAHDEKEDVAGIQDVSFWTKVRTVYKNCDKWFSFSSHPRDWDRYLAINRKLKDEFGVRITNISKV